MTMSSLTRPDPSTPRLLTLLIITLAMVGCSERSEEAPPPRFAAVSAASSASNNTWCDIQYDEATAPRLELPGGLEIYGSATQSQLPTEGWIWLNVWATWCGPCREEMPLLADWRKKLDRRAHPLSLWYLSVDEDAAAVTRYLRANPTVARGGQSIRLKQLETLPGWLKRFGMDESTAIPIHILAGPGRRVRCVRMGSVSPSDYARVGALLRAG